MLNGGGGGVARAIGVLPVQVKPMYAAATEVGESIKTGKTNKVPNGGIQCELMRVYKGTRWWRWCNCRSYLMAAKRTQSVVDRGDPEEADKGNKAYGYYYYVRELHKPSIV